MPRRPKYSGQLARIEGGWEQTFHANYAAVQRHSPQWLVALGDLIGDESLGSNRSPAHSLLLWVGPTHRQPDRSREISIELNDQGNSRLPESIQRFVLRRREVTIDLLPGEELWSGRVSYKPSADPFDPGRDAKPKRIRRLRVSFACDAGTYAKLVRLLAWGRRRSSR